ncbi:MAG: GNAT family N-acetyltransferase [Rubrivivax sp.]
MSLAALSLSPVLSFAAPARSAPAFAMRSVTVAEWDNAVAGFDAVCQEQLATFAMARWPGVALEPLLFHLDDQAIGGCLIMIQPLPLGLGAIAVAKWAPMLRRTGERASNALFGRMIDALTEEYADRRGMMLSILPRASTGALNTDYEHLTERGFRKGATLLFPDRYIVDLRLTDTEQRASFHQKWRYHLNKADKAGLTFERAEAERLPEFTALYEQMVDRKKFPDHSAYGTMPALMAMDNPTLRPELFFVRHDGRIVAGAIIFKAGDRAVYLYGATSAEALELRAGYFLHWHIIRWLRDNTPARWYDLGGTDGFHGLHQFKKGMVGERGVISPVPPVANYASRWWPRFIGEAAFAAREVLHQVERRVDWLRPDRARPDQHRTAR